MCIHGPDRPSILLKTLTELYNKSNTICKLSNTKYNDNNNLR